MQSVESHAKTKLINAFLAVIQAIRTVSGEELQFTHLQ